MASRCFFSILIFVSPLFINFSIIFTTRRQALSYRGAPLQCWVPNILQIIYDKSDWLKDRYDSEWKHSLRRPELSPPMESLTVSILSTVNTKVKQHCEQVVLMLNYCYCVNVTSSDRPHCEKVVLGLDSIPSPLFGYSKGHIYKFAETTFTLNTACCMLAQTEITLKCQSCYNVDLLRTRLNLGLNVTLLLLCQHYLDDRHCERVALMLPCWHCVK